MATYLWVEKYRPKDLDAFVWSDPTMRQKAEEWINDGALPHLLFAGRAGTGKTSLSELLMLRLEIPDGDILRIKASRERGIDIIQDRIGNFVNSWALGPTGMKYVLLDEIDAISPAAQKILRNDMETYSDVTRFIATCNYQNKIIVPVQSRFQIFNFLTLSREEYIIRAATVLMEENVTFDVDVLEAYVERSYPDLRKCIGLLEQRTLRGVLQPPKEGDEATFEYLLSVVDLFKAGKHIEARKMIISQAQPEEYNEIFRFFYQNLSLFGSTQNQQDEALLAIRTGIVNQAFVSDAEINLAATLVELCQIAHSVS